MQTTARVLGTDRCRTRVTELCENRGLLTDTISTLIFRHENPEQLYGVVSRLFQQEAAEAKSKPLLCLDRLERLLSPECAWLTSPEAEEVLWQHLPAARYREQLSNLLDMAATSNPAKRATKLLQRMGIAVASSEGAKKQSTSTRRQQTPSVNPWNTEIDFEVEAEVTSYFSERAKSVRSRTEVSNLVALAQRVQLYGPDIIWNEEGGLGHRCWEANRTRFAHPNSDCYLTKVSVLRQTEVTINIDSIRQAANQHLEEFHKQRASTVAGGGTTGGGAEGQQADINAGSGDHDELLSSPVPPPEEESRQLGSAA